MKNIAAFFKEKAMLGQNSSSNEIKSMR